MKLPALRRLAPVLILLPLALAHCGGSDNSDLDLDGDGGRVRDSGQGGASGDARDAPLGEGGPSPTCPDSMPTEGQACVGKSQVCMYGDRLCVCSIGLPWTCFDVVDAGSSPDAGRPDGGAGGADGGLADGGRQDTGSPSDARIDGARDAGPVDAPIDTRDAARDTGSDRDVNTRDTVDARVDVRDARDTGPVDVSDGRSPDDAPLDDASPDSGDDAPADDDGGDADGG